MRSLYSWLAMTLLSGGLALLTVDTAQGQPIDLAEDHLKCYQVVKDQGIVTPPPLSLFNRQFGPEKECKIANRAALLCAPTDKCKPGQNPPCDDLLGGPAAAQDYLCYRLQCPNPRRHTVRVRDQFSPNGREIRIAPARMLCTPIQKDQPPCSGSAPECGGQCPTPFQTCVPSTAAGACVCQ
jgi:hypothetical protein